MIVQGAKSIETACHLVCSTLRDHNADIPFALLYVIDYNSEYDAVNSKTARLVATTFDQNLRFDPNEDGYSFVEGDSTRNFPYHFPSTHDLVHIIDSTKNDEKYLNPTSNISNYGPNQPHESTSITMTMNENIILSNSSWPIDQVAKTNSQVIHTLADNSKAILFPILTTSAGKKVLTAIFICGINKHRVLDTEYKGFLQVSHILDNATVKS